MIRKGTPNPVAYIGEHSNSTKKPRIEPDKPIFEESIVVNCAAPDLPFDPPSEDTDLKERIKTLENELELRANIIRSLRKKNRVNNVEQSRKGGRPKEEKVWKFLRNKSSLVGISPSVGPDKSA